MRGSIGWGIGGVTAVGIVWSVFALARRAHTGARAVPLGAPAVPGA